MRPFSIILLLGMCLFAFNPAPPLAPTNRLLYNHTTSARCNPVAASAQGMVDKTMIDPSLDEQIAAFLNEINAVAGLAISVVHDDRVIYSRGFGYQDLDTCTPVTPDTRFYLKSTTKSFLGVLAAQLHEDGVVELDAPITEYLPDLAPPGVDANMLTLRQHLTHGQPYFDAGLNFQSAFVGMDEAQYVSHINTFGRLKDTRFRYSNFGPIVAAHALGEATDSNWRQLIQQKIFAPLGMTSSFTSIQAAEAGPMATAYLFDANGAFEATATKVDAQMHAAGGSISTANDLSRWLMASLNDGKIDGKQAFSPRAFQQAHARQINMDWTYNKFRRFAHGFGHYSADYEGDLLMHHFGGETHVSFMPEHGWGVAVLSNQIQGGAFTTHRLAALIYDILLEKEDIAERWAKAGAEIREAVDNMQQRKRAHIEQLQSSAPDAEAMINRESLAGRYTNERIGDMVFSSEGDQITMQYGALEGVLTHVKGNAYIADFMPWGGPPELFVFRHDASSGHLLMDWGGRIFNAH